MVLRQLVLSRSYGASAAGTKSGVCATGSRVAARAQDQVAYHTLSACAIFLRSLHIFLRYLPTLSSYAICLFTDAIYLRGLPTLSAYAICLLYLPTLSAYAGMARADTEVGDAGTEVGDAGTEVGGAGTEVGDACTSEMGPKAGPFGLQRSSSFAYSDDEGEGGEEEEEREKKEAESGWSVVFTTFEEDHSSGDSREKKGSVEPHVKEILKR
eukprot:2381188-Rhodomonas_salina.1